MIQLCRDKFQPIPEQIICRDLIELWRDLFELYRDIIELCRDLIELCRDINELRLDIISITHNTDYMSR